jgi:uncharacterized membrane protein YkoI
MSKKKMIGALLITAVVLGAGMFGLRAGMFSAPTANAGNGVSVTAPKATTPTTNPAATGENQSEKDSGKNVQNPSYVGSIKVTDKNSASETTEASTYSKMAKITPDQASKAALAKVPGTLIGKIALDNENGVLVYSAQIKDKSGAIHDVKVDAGNGKVLFVGKAGSEDSELESGKEASTEEKHAKELDTDTIELQQGGQSGPQTDTP